MDLSLAHLSELNKPFCIKTCLYYGKIKNELKIKKN